MFIDPKNRLDFTYPERSGTLSRFRYETGLMLLRLRDAVKMRSGADADYIVGADFTVSLEVDGKETQITVPSGMVTDLASVPWIARWLVGRVGPHLEAAIVHDFLYIARPGQSDVPDREKRKFADDVMMEAMRAAEVLFPMRWGIYLAVRLFGGKSFQVRTADSFVDLAAVEVTEQFPVSLTQTRRA